jgi:Sulfotransferase family
MRSEVLAPLPTGKKRVKVLFIVGPTRTGSTIISNILGQIDGFFHAGEVIEAWDRGKIWKCSCGQFPMECPVWSKIFKSLDAAVNNKDQSEIIRMRNKMSRSHKVIVNHYLPKRKTDRQAAETRYLYGLAKLYSIIQAETGANVIIDSSKNVGYGDTLKNVENIDLYLVHLVRDARATAFSWSRKKKELWDAHPLKTAVQWSSRNIAAELLSLRKSGRAIKIRYEDFIAHPRQGVHSILKLLTISNARLPFISPDEVMLGNSHGLCGNPGRYNSGAVKLRIDNRWKGMKRSDNLVATFFTWPLLIKYHYPLL